MPDLRNRIIIGAGLSGLAAGCWCAREGPGRSVTILEKDTVPLRWLDHVPDPLVAVGRLDSRAEWDAERYPRGYPLVERLLEKWPGSATRDWLESLGLTIRVDPDGTFRAAPADLRACLERDARQHGVLLRYGFAVESISLQGDGSFRVWSRDGDAVEAVAVVLATGGERNHGMKLAQEFGAQAEPVVPAYLRLRFASPKLGERLGPWTGPIGLRCPKSGLRASGTASVSARGLEGLALSRLSAPLCTDWQQRSYRVQLEVDWLPGDSPAAVRNVLSSRCQRGGRRPVGEDPQFGLGEKQWGWFLQAARIDADLPWPRVKAKSVQALTQRLKADLVAFDGMGLPAAERAWAGGITLACIDAGSCQSLQTPRLHFAGEMLDILGLPDGAHLNAAWSSGCLAGHSLAR